MRMGNLFTTALQYSRVMSAEHPRLGVDHPTVVPRPPRETDDAEASTDESDRSAGDAAERRPESADA